MSVLAPIRVLLADLPQLQRDLLQRALDDAPDIELAVEHEPADLLDAVRDHDPEFVLVACEHGELGTVGAQLLAPRTPQLVGVEVETGNAFLFRLRPERLLVGAVSPADVVELIRGAREAAA